MPADQTGEFLQDIIAGQMSVLVIDILKAINIKDANCKDLACPVMLRPQLFQPFVNITPIENTCQRIADRNFADPLFCFDMLGDIPGGSVNRRSVRMRPPFDIAIRAIFATVAVDKIQHRVLLRQNLHLLQRCFNIIRMDKVEKSLLRKFCNRIAQDIFPCLI